MRRLFAVAVMTTALTPFAVVIAQAQNLELRRVVLSQGGVGYFEYEAEVAGNAELNLAVRLDQVDDVLKSIVVFDDRGGVGGVRLAGQEPLSEAFRDLPFAREALDSPVTLLNALQGAEVRVTGPNPISGRIVRVVQEESHQGERTVMRNRVSVMGATGLQSFILEEAASVTFADPQLQAEIERALRAVAENRTRDRRNLTVIARGAERRLVRVGYVVEAPLWKTSYRLVVNNDPNVTRNRIQGWAVIENLTGTDWRNVDLSLVSGNPVTFRQALYRPFFVQRPEVPVEVYGRILPRVDDGVIGGAAAGDRLRGGTADAREETNRQQIQASGRAMAAPSAQAMPRNLAEAPPPPPAPSTMAAANAATATEAQEAATQVTFRFAQPINVSAGQTFVAPIIDRELPAQSVALYQPDTNPRNPLAAVRLANDGEVGLPPGVVTLYERTEQGLAHVGDARMGPVAGGQSRLLSFAIDTKTQVVREIANAQNLARGSIAGGVLRLTRIDRQTVTYRVTAPPREARAVMLEQTKPAGWRLVDPASGTEETPTAWRFTRRLNAGENATVTVVLERPREETLRLLDLQRPQLEAFARSTELTQAVRDAFVELGRLRATVDEKRGDLEKLRAERTQIEQDQARIRQNMGTVPRESQLFRQYMERMTTQETRLDQLRVAQDAAERALQEATNTLTAAIQRLAVN
jgi:flagellar biosynthesis chaperone FliJ